MPTATSRPAAPSALSNVPAGNGGTTPRISANHAKRPQPCPDAVIGAIDEAPNHRDSHMPTATSQPAAPSAISHAPDAVIAAVLPDHPTTQSALSDAMALITQPPPSSAPSARPPIDVSGAMALIT